MSVTKVSLPSNSMLTNSNYDYVDCYKSDLNLTAKVDSLMVGKAFFSSSPKWIDSLFETRNRIVSILGLKTGGEIKNKEELLNNFKGVVGEQLGLFKVHGKSDTEIIIGEDDKHLDFRISLLLENTELETRSLTISTTVKFNNGFGKLYFMPVKPFHKIIVPIMLKGIIKEIEKESH